MKVYDLYKKIADWLYNHPVVKLLTVALLFISAIKVFIEITTPPPPPPPEGFPTQDTVKEIVPPHVHISDSIVGMDISNGQTEESKNNTDTIETQILNEPNQAIKDSILKAFEEARAIALINEKNKEVQQQSMKIQYEVITADVNNDDNESSQNSIVMQLSDKPLSKGFGRLIARSMSKWCGDGTIFIYSGEHQEGGGLFVLYDPTKKERTSFMLDLPPGEYKAKVHHQYLKDQFFDVSIEEGKITQYIYDRINAYGNGMGQLTFILKNPNGNYQIIVNENVIANITPESELPKNDKGYRVFGYNTKGEQWYKFTVRNLKEQKFIDDKKTADQFLHTGANIPIEVY